MLGAAADGYWAFNGQIAEVLVYNRALTATERANIEGALMAKYIDPDSDADGLPDAWEDLQLGTRTYGPTDDPGGVVSVLDQESSPKRARLSCAFRWVWWNFNRSRLPVVSTDR